MTDAEALALLMQWERTSDRYRAETERIQSALSEAGFVLRQAHDVQQFTLYPSIRPTIEGWVVSLYGALGPYGTPFHATPKLTVADAVQGAVARADEVLQEQRDRLDRLRRVLAAANRPNTTGEDQHATS